MERNYSKESRKRVAKNNRKKGETFWSSALIPACPAAAVLHNVLLVPAVATTDDGPSRSGGGRWSVEIVRKLLISTEKEKKKE